MTRGRRRFACFVLAFVLCRNAAEAQGVKVEDTRILLETGAFDPLRGPQRIPPELRLASEEATDRWIVQFRAPLTREQRERLTKDFGLKLTRYIPNLAYLQSCGWHPKRRQTVGSSSSALPSPVSSGRG